MQSLIGVSLLGLSMVLLVYCVLKRFASFRPFLFWLAQLNARLPLSGYRKFFQRNLIGPGQEGIPDFNELMAIKELIGLAVFISLFFLFSLPFALALSGALLFFFLPDVKLRDNLLKRQTALRRDFVSFLDLMVLVLESGLDIVSGLQYLAGRFPPGPLMQEVEQFLLEIKLGASREKALNAFADRTGDADIREFVSTINASEKSGSPLSRSLKNLSVTIKTARIQKAEKTAYEAPVKLLFPLVVFIFPVVFVVLFGPIIISFLK